MEYHAIGEVFEFEGKKYKVVKDKMWREFEKCDLRINMYYRCGVTHNCVYNKKSDLFLNSYCYSWDRDDGQGVHYVEVK